MHLKRFFKMNYFPTYFYFFIRFPIRYTFFHYVHRLSKYLIDTQIIELTTSNHSLQFLFFNLTTITWQLRLKRESNTNNDSRQDPSPIVKYQMFGQRQLVKKRTKITISKSENRKWYQEDTHTQPNYLFGEASHCNYLRNALVEDFIEAQKEKGNRGERKLKQNEQIRQQICMRQHFPGPHPPP